MKYSRGAYQIILFGEYGDKINKKTATNFHAARAIASNHEKAIKNGSSVINRTIWNSKDCDNKWDYKDDNG